MVTREKGFVLNAKEKNGSESSTTKVITYQLTPSGSYNSLSSPSGRYCNCKTALAQHFRCQLAHLY